MLAVGAPDTSFSKDRKLSSAACSFPFWSMTFTAAFVRPQAWSTLGTVLSGAVVSAGFSAGRRITWTFEPPNPKELMPMMPPRMGIGLSTTWTRPSLRAGMSGLGLLKWRLGAHTPRSRESNTFVWEEKQQIYKRKFLFCLLMWYLRCRASFNLENGRCKLWKFWCQIPLHRSKKTL